MATLGLENCVMRLPQGWYLQKKICNQVKLVDFTSPSQVGFLDSNFLRTFGGPNEVCFGPTLARFKGLEVSYNFHRNSLLHKTHGFFVILKIPLGGQNCKKLTSSKLIQKSPSCIFSSQTPSKLSQNHKNFRV